MIPAGVDTCVSTFCSWKESIASEWSTAYCFGGVISFSIDLSQFFPFSVLFRLHACFEAVAAASSANFSHLISSSSSFSTGEM